MAKLLHVLKLNLFKDQFRLTEHEATSCLEFGLFAVLIYCKTWTTSTNSCDVPINDLSLIQLLTKYKTSSPVISTVGLRAMGCHLWYLGLELSPLALFSDQMSPEVKQKIACRVKSGRSCSIRYTDQDDLSEKTLEYFIGRSSHLFFRILQINTAFMESDVHSLAEEATYKKAKKIIKSLKVVNDAAERGIALATSFNYSLTRREDEKQLLYQMVENDFHILQNVPLWAPRQTEFSKLLLFCV